MTENTAIETITLTVPGMTCGHCQAAVSGAVGSLPGVERVDVNLDTKLVTVGGRDLDRAVIVAAIDRAGFDTSDDTADDPENATGE